jgi:hypothetical protein
VNRLDVLIHRHLEGSISEPEAAELGGLLKADPVARRRMAEMAFDAVSLRDVLAQRPAARRWKLAPVPLAAAAALFAVVTGVVLFAPGPTSPTPPGPVPAPVAPRYDRARGFAESVAGVVTGRAEGSFRLSVTESYGHPLMGRTISVAPGFARSDAGDLMPNRVHAAFVRRLAEGQELTIDVRHVSDDVFVIGDLTKEQSDWALKRGDVRKPKPEREGDRKDAPREGSKEGPKEGDKEK